ncbi:murein hydrolase activator EnvC family protein [Muriicola soli]|uniref:Peptidase M23 n=1 Tax=Muriicola soli TaxID=2507538 RepID=A0A411ECM6_9FLAO|nr:peptidoglycan DD-metalloendopeptidase family protein [Muriicola soli]QBA65439.1 peptidase M23 [Muriicola soli]
MNTFFGQRLTLILTICLLYGIAGVAQTNEQKALEEKREQLQKEITEMNRLLFAERKQRGTVLDQLELLDQKINVRQQLIRVTNQQSNLLSRQVNANIRNIAKLREDLDILKDEYANMIRKSYRNRSQQSRLMFLLSSSNFYQAYKRLQYLKQYTRYRKEQGVQIAEKTEDLITLNNDLTRQRREKESLIAENKLARKELFEEINEQKGLLKTIRQNESNYAVAINKKKAEARKIDEQIERLIRSAIAASNKKAGNAASSSRFVLTPEATVIANNFSANKGRLIWPVEKGIKRQGFGIYSDAVYPGIKHQNNGVIIATDKGAKARAVFEGEVIAIMAVPGGGKGVQVKHGNYISTYYNLANLFVKKGDKVIAKEELGEIYTNRLNGLTQLKFYLYRDATRLNPEDWIYQL